MWKNAAIERFVVKRVYPTRIRRVGGFEWHVTGPGAGGACDIAEMEVNRDHFNVSASVLSSSYRAAEEETVDVPAPAPAAIAFGVQFHLRFLVRFWDVSNVSRPRRHSLSETRAMYFRKRTDGRMMG